LKHRIVLLRENAIYTIFKLGFCLSLCFILSACSEQDFAAPACRSKAISNQQVQMSLAHASKAACITRVGEYLLVMKRPSGRYDLPYSDKLSNSSAISNNSANNSANNSTNSLVEKHANALQCRAHLAMWEQSGFNTEVGAMLSVHKGVSQTYFNTALFACKLESSFDGTGFNGTEGTLPAPPWKPDEVSQLEFIKPFEIEHDQWEDPDTFTHVRDAFVNFRQL
jgi:hypothetical protein